MRMSQCVVKQPFVGHEIYTPEEEAHIISVIFYLDQELAKDFDVKVDELYKYFSRQELDEMRIDKAIRLE